MVTLVSPYTTMLPFLVRCMQGQRYKLHTRTEVIDYL